MSKPKQIPEFKSEAEERAFWEDPKNNALDYFAVETERRYADHASPATRSISLRLPVQLIEELKRIGAKRDVPYQTLIKMYVADRVDAELGRGRFAGKSARTTANVVTRTLKTQQRAMPLDPLMAPAAKRTHSETIRKRPKAG